MGYFGLKIYLLIVAIFVGMLLRVNSQENEFVLHPEKLDSFYYRAAISALLKSKFKALTKQVDDVDRIIYTECHREAQTIVQQAKCLIKLMDARDRRESRDKSATSSVEFVSHNEDNPLKVFLNAILTTNWEKITNGLKKPDPVQMKPNFKLRRKRSVENSYLTSEEIQSKEFKSLPKSIQNLRKIERYLRLADHVKDYSDKLNSENAQHLQSMNFPTEFRARPPAKFSAFETFQEFLNDAPFERISVLSPRIMSLFPSAQTSSNTNDWSKLFSPTLFSFHEEGAFPLPNFFKMVLSDQKEIHAWLDLLLQWSGAAKTLDQMINTMKPEMIEVEQELFPKIKHLEELDERWQEFESKQSGKQREEMNKNGYTYLDSNQANFLFDNVPEHVHYTSKQKEHMLEKKIRQLALLDEQMIREKTLKSINKNRVRRQSPQFPSTNYLDNNLYPSISPQLPSSQPEFNNYLPNNPIPPSQSLFTTPFPPISQNHFFPTMQPLPEYFPNNNLFTTPFQPINQNIFTTPLPPLTQSQFPNDNIFTTPFQPINHNLFTTSPPFTPNQASEFPHLSHFTSTYIPPISNQFINPTPGYPPPYNNEFYRNQFTTNSPNLHPSTRYPTPSSKLLVTTQNPNAFTIPSVDSHLTTLAPPTTHAPPTIPGLEPPPDFKSLKKMLGLGDDISESPDAEHGEAKVVVLEPWAVSHRIGGFVILEGIVLSPHAVTSELFSPELLTFHVLTPRAFLAAALSPMALFARILSPSAFRAEVLSPQALSAYVLTPEAFLAEILSPKILEVRVLSPKAFTLQVLSPVIGSPKVQSPESLGIIVLSPSILSPHIMSDGCLNVEILSPHLLSGHDEHEHGSHGSHDENHAGHKSHHYCCNKRLNRCCNQKVPKHESNSHFNQFIHSTMTTTKSPNKSAYKYKTNLKPANYVNIPPRNSYPSLGKLPTPVLPYAFWGKRLPATGLQPQILPNRPMDTTKLMTKQARLQPKMPLTKILISKQKQKERNYD